MPNSPDFRSDQIQINKLIVSGANAGSTECLLVYPLSAQGTPNNQGNINPAIFDTSPIGSDVFFYVSGSVGGKGGSTPSIVVFGGDLHVSGNLSVDGAGAGSGGGETIWLSTTTGSAHTTGSVQVTGSFEVLGGITGSLSGTTNGNPFLVGNPGITANYNSGGQWELSASSKIPILAGVVTTTLSASTIAGYALFTDLNSPSYTLEGIGFASVAGVTGSLELYDLVNSSSLSSLSWTETTPMHKTASFVATGSSRVLELRVNKSGGSISDYALFSAVFFG